MCCRRSDLDIIIVLKCNQPTQQPFEMCRMRLLGQVQQQLCRPLSSASPCMEGSPPDAKEQLKATAACGWQLPNCVPCYYLTLQHPVLCMQLDIQVGGPEAAKHALPFCSNATCNSAGCSKVCRQFNGLCDVTVSRSAHLRVSCMPSPAFPGCSP
jgi:hypothetical protein